MRLDKFLSSMGYTRSEAIELISKGNVSVNGCIVGKKDVKINENLDSVCVNNKKIEYKKYIYIMLNKPLGFVCANFDKQEKTVFELLDSNLKKYNIFCVGRLDKDTTGLIFLTNDGEFCHNLTNPKKEKNKIYEFELADIISNDDVIKLKNGVELNDGLKTKPCKIELETDKTGLIEITEGKYHQVRRMFASVGNKVVKLNRVEIAGIRLDSSLKIGDYRELTAQEIEVLKTK